MTAKQRVARDKSGIERTLYEDIEVGADLGTMEWRFDGESIARLCESDDDFHEWYSVESPYDGIIAPVLISYPPVRMLFTRRYNVRGLFYGFEMESYAPLKPDTTYILSGLISDKWIKRNREYVQYEATCVDPQGKKIFMTRRAHALDFLTVDTPKEGVGIDSGAGQVTHFKT